VHFRRRFHGTNDRCWQDLEDGLFDSVIRESTWRPWQCDCRSDQGKSRSPALPNSKESHVISHMYLRQKEISSQFLEVNGSILFESNLSSNSDGMGWSASRTGIRRALLQRARPALLRLVSLQQTRAAVPQNPQYQHLRTLSICSWLELCACSASGAMRYGYLCTVRHSSLRGGHSAWWTRHNRAAPTRPHSAAHDAHQGHTAELLTNNSHTAQNVQSAAGPTHLNLRLWHSEAGQCCPAAVHRRLRAFSLFQNPCHLEVRAVSPHVPGARSAGYS
jgi:hypothetical protein